MYSTIKACCNKTQFLLGWCFVGPFLMSLLIDPKKPLRRIRVFFLSSTRRTRLIVVRPPHTSLGFSVSTLCTAVLRSVLDPSRCLNLDLRVSSGLAPGSYPERLPAIRAPYNNSFAPSLQLAQHQQHRQPHQRR